MEQALLILALIALLIYAFAKLRYELHMMQLNSYRNERYGKWLKNNLVIGPRIWEVIMLAITGVLIFLASPLVTALAFISCFGLLAWMLFAKKQKKPVVFTSRATRLFATLFALTVILAGVHAIFAHNGVMSLWGLAFLTFLSFVLIFVANMLMAPVEASVNRWYYKDAQRILSERPDLIIIGITGSYGKTSTKHFLHRMLSEKYNVLMTPGSFNTTMGVIRTIREQLQATHQVFIAEMGAKQFHDIKEICDLVHPHIGILTAVGEQHLETFKTIQNVQKTKFELIDALPSGALAVLNHDYEFVANRPVSDRKTAYYSAEDPSIDYYIGNVSYSARGSEFTVFHKGEAKGTFQTRLVGSYNLSNILASYIVAKNLDVSDTSIAFAIKKLEPVQHRLEVKVHGNGVTVIDDAFNSNPVGSKMALEVLKGIEGTRKIIITPGMIELGDKQEHYNMLLGEQMADSCDYVVVVAKTNSAAILKGLKNKNYPDEQIYMAQNFKDATGHLGTMVKAGDVLLYENDLPDTYES
ncbi:UDP-N-acetylmuramoyl-tripeptide--D-alanyl-D-alanine ligase [Mucilaginibacter yixingensis]|uniref:UDP-N-acetylmuramoyl-tripeptide--D-alanyl-D-alanine ligase n=1 Tax=Mucilaginibacter yixingensis TaxID=1295612 RepID=A0A2T5JCF7_9SPHI|nr:UDP-N-acetylmuramoyl-tripeptide--D-alanyl-D-alanine ligase [Mucilaginibacter yixingensis]PTQ99446.1 UDP-N-acetylmuramoyl-tripeptide--D-alanyl-D-alanine ligase [Mucilaginibacter yixingensis]